MKESIDRPRIHHQLAPMQIEFEEDMPGVCSWTLIAIPPKQQIILLQDVLTELSSKGHVLHPDGAPGVVCAISRGEDGRVYANADGRKDGGVDGY